MKITFTSVLATVFALISQLAQAQFTTKGNAAEISTARRPNSFQLTADQSNQNSAVWNNTPINIQNNSFTLTFSANFGSKDATGGEGIALLFHNDPRGSAATGTDISSQYLGYQGIAPSLNVEFDANVNRGNSGNNAPDVIGISQNTTAATAGRLMSNVHANARNSNIENGGEHNVEVTWDALAQTLYIYFNGNLRQTYNSDVVTNIFGGNPLVYWGFTASTGTLSNLQSVYQVNLTLTDVSNKIISPLPVSLVKFAVAKSGNGNKLTWATASEKNSAYFQVERSTDAKTWTPLTQIASQGNSNTVINYEFTDAAVPVSLVYYRLKMVDTDETAEYSKVVSLRSASRNGTAVTVFPNPAQNNETLHITFEAPENADATIWLTDLMGNVVKSEKQPAVAGTNTYSLSLALVKPGMYLVQIVSGGEKETARVVVH